MEQRYTSNHNPCKLRNPRTLNRLPLNRFPLNRFPLPPEVSDNLGVLAIEKRLRRDLELLLCLRHLCKPQTLDDLLGTRQPRREMSAPPATSASRWCHQP
jgi:hypothetical protein